jgi:glycosyltransferase involved in cell wall biosynthesis
METRAFQRIAIDVREACRERKTGKGQWVTGFVTELLLRNIPLVLVTDSALPKEWKGKAEAVFIPAKGFAWHWKARSWLKKHPDVLYISTVSFIVPALAPAGSGVLTVVHDMIAWRNDRHDRKAKWIERMLLPLALKKSMHVFAISDSTKRDLLAKFPSFSPERVSAIYAGPMHPHPGKNVSDGRTIVCIGTLCPRKNQKRLLEAYRSLTPEQRSGTSLVLAGARGWSDDAIVTLAKSMPEVRYEQYVSAQRYEELLGTCAVFALPSLYEGFGMQILDALQRGIPTLTSSRGSLAEVAEGAALTVDPESVPAIADGLVRLLTDDALRRSLRDKAVARAAAYSWRRTVDLALTALQKRQLLH